MLGKTKHIHIVGIGGAGLSGIAEILLNLKFKVSGSDLRLTEVTEHLTKIGAEIYKNHSSNQIQNADVVVVSPAIPLENPEIVAASNQKIPIIRGAEMLAEIMRMKFSIAISGTHGKTTTTAMTAAVLEKLDPTVIVGGKLVNVGSYARIGDSNIMVVEADEAYGSIEKFFPTIATVTSIDADHLDYYKNVGEISHTFLNFINKVPFYGSAIVCSDQINIRQIIPHIEKQYCTYGIENQSDVMASDIQYDGPTSHFSVLVHENLVGKIHLKMPGKHNVSNALAAISVGQQMDLSFNQTKEALENFRGVHRRFEVLGEAQDIIIVDDYAHNPTKLKAALDGTRASYDRRIIAIFQPHRYGRVKHLADEFSKSFSQSDVLIVAPIYAANEAPIDGVTAEKLAKAIAANGHGNITYISSKDEIVNHVINIVQPNDIVITMGAGDIWKVGHKLLDQLTK